MKRMEKKIRNSLKLLHPNVVAMGSLRSHGALEYNHDIIVGNVCARCQLDQTFRKSPLTLRLQFYLSRV